MSDIPVKASEIRELIRELADKVYAAIENLDDAVFVGIRSGGEHIAYHIVKLIEKKSKKKLKFGELDIALYRDDLSKRLAYPEVRSTNIPFDIEGKRVILVDDVLNTGRSVRAAIDHLVDLGRPRRIYLLVLFDRGGRELPIQADFIGRTISLEPDRIVKIQIPKDESKVGSVIIMEARK